MASSVNLINKTLPVEIMTQIFYNLPHEEKKNARLVCHLWRCHLDSGLIYRPKVTNESLKRFIQSYRVMETATISGLTTRISHPKNELPVIKNIVFMGPKNSEANVMNFLKNGCKQAESLFIQLKTLARVRTNVLSGALPNIHWNTLSKLELQVQLYRKSQNDMKHLKSSSVFLKYAKIPGLRDFKFEFTIRAWMKPKAFAQSQRVIQNFLYFIAANASSLKNLDYVVKCRVSRDLGLEIRLGVFQIQLNPRMESLLVKIGRGLRLKRVRMEFDAISRVEQMIWPEFFGSELQDMEIIVGRSHVGRLQTNFLNTAVMQRIFEANSKTLEKVTLEAQIFDLSWLQNFSALKSFNLQLRGRGLCMRSNRNPNSSQLKSISLSEFTATDFPRLKQLMIENATTLERVELFLEDCKYEQRDHDWNWMNELVHLKSLWFRYHWSFLELVQEEIGDLAIWRNLTELDIDEPFTNIDFSEQTGTQIANWIRQTLPNLQILHLPKLRVSALQIYMRLEQLKKISFLDTIEFTAADNTTESEIYNFCLRSPSLRLTIKPKVRRPMKVYYSNNTDAHDCFLSIERARD